MSKLELKDLDSLYTWTIYMYTTFRNCPGAEFWRDVCYLARGRPLSASNLEQNFPTPDFPEQVFLAFIRSKMGVDGGATSE